MKKLILVLLLVILLFTGYTGVVLTGDPQRGMPPLQDGDLIFQTAMSSQTNAILVATASRYSHSGIIKRMGNGYVVIEAAAEVKETPFNEWIENGNFRRFAVFRHAGMTEEKARKIFSESKKYYGKPYDIFFLFGAEAFYCSELPFVAFKQAGLVVGAVEQVKSLNVNNSLVKALIEQRWQRHPVCKKAAKDFEQCYQIIMDQELVTPVSLTRGEHMQQIFTNYPF